MLPFDDGEARVDASGSSGPVIDEDGLVRHRGAWVAMSPKLEVIFRYLLRSRGKVVSRGALEELLWPDGHSDPRRLDALVARLRTRLRPLGLTVRTVRTRGFLLEVDVGDDRPKDATM